MVWWPMSCCPAPRAIAPAGSSSPRAGRWACSSACFAHSRFSGAHLNPAVTLALAAAGKLAWAKVPGYFVAQMLGAFAGATAVFVFYREHFKATEDDGAKLACFSTAPNIRNLPQAFFCEMAGTFLLVLPVFLMTDASVTLVGGSGSVHAGRDRPWLSWGFAGGAGGLCHRSVARRHNRLRHQSRARPGPASSPCAPADPGQA